MKELSIEKMATPLFNLIERRYPVKIEFQRIGGGIAIISKIQRTMTTSDNSPLQATLSLGRYIEQNPNVLEEIKESLSYNLSAIDNYLFNLYARDFSDEIKKKIPTLKYTNCWDYKKFTFELINWIKACGVPKSCIMKGQVLLKPIDILNILEFCLDTFTTFQKITDDDYKLKDNEEISFSITYTYKKSNNDDEKLIVKELKTLQDIINKDLLTCIKHKEINVNCKVLHLKECEYCGDFFFGRRNKKCCSNYCKDLKNKKYEKKKNKRRKEKEK